MASSLMLDVYLLSASRNWNIIEKMDVLNEPWNPQFDGAEICQSLGLETGSRLPDILRAQMADTTAHACYYFSHNDSNQFRMLFFNTDGSIVVGWSPVACDVELGDDFDALSRTWLTRFRDEIGNLPGYACVEEAPEESAESFLAKCI